MSTSFLLSSAVWIASPLAGSPRVGVPAPFLRKAFSIDEEVSSATLQVTALGLYECEINGQQVGNQVFGPGWTDYRKRVPFQTFDVTMLLHKGENVIGALLGDGWYCGFVGWNARQVYGDRPRLLARLEIRLANGLIQTVETDASWKVAASPLLANDLLQGETYDARLELPGWAQSGFDDSTWQGVMVMSDSEITIEPSPAPPVRRMGELREVSRKSISSPGRKIVVDFGQNFTGRVRVMVTAARGTTLILRHAEILNPDGTLYLDNLRGAKATDYYTCSGNGPETWEPRFTFHGFRYAEISGQGDEDTVEAIGIVLHSDTPPTGSFICSHPLLNQLQHNIQWGQKSNFLEVPTDCPQRDERLGWTGDAQVFVRTASFNMDVRGFFHKWARDLRDCQNEDGGVPAVIPDAGFLGGPPAADGGPAWADAAIICPWTIYLCYGDVEILRENYGAMQKFMDFIAAKRCQGHIRSHPDVDPWGGYGDWLALDGSGKNEGGTPRDLIGTAFYAYDAGIMSQIATVLGKNDDARMFSNLREKIVAAFQWRYVTPEGLMASGTQTSYVLGLHFGLIPENARRSAARELVRDIERQGFHLATGFVGTPYLLEVLENHGYLGVAYQLLEQETFPSWLFPVKNGATTIWERWDGWTPERGFQDKGMNSFNHYAYGAVGAWMYRTVAGLELDPQEPAYRHIIFRPRPGGTITWAQAALKTPQGDVKIRWDLTKDRLIANLTVPPNSRATFSAPDGYLAEVTSFGPGSHCVAAHRASQANG